MRAKTISKKTYVFDFDDTLVKTDAKIHIIKNGKRIKSLSPSEYNTYIVEPSEQLDMEDFNDPRRISDIIYRAQKYKMWPLLQRAYMENIDIWILTARGPNSRKPIHSYLKSNGIDIPIDRVITVGNDHNKSQDTATEKRKVLKILDELYKGEVYFFDDSEENIELAKNLGIKTKLVDWYEN